MYAYSPNGNAIVSTKETIPGTCEVTDDSYSVVDGRIDFDHAGGTDVDWNGQKTVEVLDQKIFIDDAELEWPACALVVVPRQIDPDSDDAEDREIPVEKIEAAKKAFRAWKASKPFVGTVAAPKNGWEDASSLTDAERALLSPIAATLALLAGHDAAKIAADPKIVADMLPKAMALTTSAGTTVSALADVADLYPSKAIPLPSVVNGRQVVDLVDGAGTTIVEVTDIVWDTDGRTHDLPTTMIAAVDHEWNEDGGIVDMLSDTFGFCILSIGCTTELDRSGRPVELSWR